MAAILFRGTDLFLLLVEGEILGLFRHRELFLLCRLDQLACAFRTSKMRKLSSNFDHRHGILWESD
jgi:hypothetical protein